MDEMSNPGQNSSSQLECSSRSDDILRYIDEFLMEDDLEPHVALLQESSEFRAKERSFYDLLEKKYPPSPQQELVDDAKDTSCQRERHKIVPIKEFNDDVWDYAVDGRDYEKLAASIANMQLRGPTQQPPPPPTKTILKKKKHNNTKQIVDLGSLLMDCAKSISVGDCDTAESLLALIRKYSSPSGDGNQRMAHYFADGLEARLYGCNKHGKKITSSPDYLRVYRFFRATSQFRKTSSFAGNETILDRSKGAARIHVIDFGILYGFQWPAFIRRVAGREGGPPKMLRITGVEFPLTAGIMEDTGRRLVSYAETLGVPFEFRAIAREWESVKTEDLGIHEDEFVAVVCSIQSMKLMDEEDDGLQEIPRDMVLRLIRGINPDIFVHGILNGPHNQPFFMSRFRDLVYHFMSVFDIFETLVPRDNPERTMMERDLIGKDILNMIACEGSERVERPETHRQWHVRHVKAGFVSVPLQRDLMDAIVCKVSSFYHKDYLMYEENQWLMMCWKGRAIFAMSCWQPAAV